jgi:hypothetical protein
MSLMIVSKVGWVIFAVTLCQLAAALIVLHRHRIAELAKKIFYGWI